MTSASPRRAVRVAIWLAAALLLAGCSGLREIPLVYKLDVQQGNLVDEYMVSQLEMGMEKRKVLFLLGTPLLTDTFNEERWDYVYSHAPGGTDRSQRRLALYFDGDLLSRIEGDIKPSKENPPEPPRDVVVRVPPAAPPEGLLASLKPDFLDNDKKEQATAVASAAAPAAATTTALPAAQGVSTELADPKARAAEEDFFRAALSGYGPGAPETPAPGAGTTAAAAEPAPPISQEASGEDATFFRGLLERFRDAQPPAAPATPTRRRGQER